MLRIDLNCDMGEGYPHDAAIMPFISSVNIACGYHAGDEQMMKKTVAAAIQHKVAIGAHPSYPDRENFGRNDILHTKVSPEDLQPIIAKQIILLQEICQSLGAALHHVKPHGALYNRAAKDEIAAECICAAMQEADPSLLLYGLSGSAMETAAEKYQLKFVSEAFADRTYQDDGSLTSRKVEGALIENTDQAVKQALQMIIHGNVNTINGKRIPIKAETICIHGDGPHAVAFVKGIHTALHQEHITIRQP